MDNQELKREIELLYRGWIGALQQKKYEWFDRYLAEDYTCTAHPFEHFFLRKAAFIEADKKIDKIDVEFIEVIAHQIGNSVVSHLVLKVIEERLATDLGGRLPTVSELGQTVTGKTVAYVSAWRKEGRDWRCYDHHLIGPVD
jgi:ketosteroid isomerase-like protein